MAAVSRRIDATDREIDRLVYELYGLTDEEIRAKLNSCESSYRTQCLKLARAQYRT